MKDRYHHPWHVMERMVAALPRWISQTVSRASPEEAHGFELQVHATNCSPLLLEPPGMLSTDGNRANGVTLAPWSKGKCLVWNATCVDTM
jgi:hypothetical protein